MATWLRAFALAIGVSLLLVACSGRPCWTDDDDVGKAIPAAVTALAHDELACADPIDISVTTVPFGTAWEGEGCGKHALYRCTCEHRPVDTCHAQCVNPACELLGCGTDSLFRTYSRGRCVWRK